MIEHLEQIRLNKIRLSILTYFENVWILLQIGGNETLG